MSDTNSPSPSPTLTRDLFGMMATDKLGEGLAREVFVFGPDDTLVIKFESGDRSFQNIAEYHLWQEVEEVEKLRRWLAPIHQISPCGTILLQKRTKPVTIAELKKELPKVPRFFTDLKPANWGRLGQHIVCHDYGCHRAFNHGLDLTMRRAVWWE